MQFWHRVKIIKSIIHNNVTIREELHKDRQYFKCSIFNPRWEWLLEITREQSTNISQVLEMYPLNADLHIGKNEPIFTL